MAAKTLVRSFAGGEIGAQLFSRIDLDKYQTGVALCRNMIIMPQGPAVSRPGFGFVNRTRYSDKRSRLIPFAFSTQQTYTLEFGDLYVRFHTSGGTLLDGNQFISAVTNANPGVFTASATHGLVVGKWVFFSVISGMPTISNRWWIVATVPTGTTFTVTDLRGNVLSTVGLPIFGGGLPKFAQVYELATPYAHTELEGLRFVQSADVLTLVHQGYAPRELRRSGPINWSLDLIVFSTSLAAPQSTGAVSSPILHEYQVQGVAPTQGGWVLPGVGSVSNDLTIPGRRNAISWSSVPGAIHYRIYKKSGAAYGQIGIAVSDNVFYDDGTIAPDLSSPPFSPQSFLPAPSVAVTALAPPGTGVQVVPTGGGGITYTYVVTSVSDNQIEESLASAPVSTTNNLGTAGNVNTVSWPAVPGVNFYRVYRLKNGLYGLVGSSGAECSFVDDNVLPDVSQTPPLQISPFTGDFNYPQAVTYHQQRRVFGGSINKPQTLWMTRSGTEKNMAFSRPGRDDDSITMGVVSREAHTIRHLVPMDDLLLLTSGGEWKVAASDSGPLTPSNVSAKQQGYSGSNNAQPVVTDSTVLYAQDRGGHVREIQFAWEKQGYRTSDVSILAPHLFDFHTVKQMAFVRAPQPIFWAVRDDGLLLGMTYVTEHEVRAWHRHDTAGLIESVCSVAEGDEDVLYAIVQRTITGVAERYVERLHTRRFDTPADQFFLDCAISYSGTPATVFGGLQHLDGMTVSILADGGVEPQQVVSGGQITLSAAASKVVVGLPYVCQGQTLPLAVQLQAFGQGTVKNVNKVHMRVFASNGFTAGPDFDHLQPYKTRYTEPFGSPPDLTTGEVEITFSPSWNRNGFVCWEQRNPVALTVMGIAIEYVTGG